MTAIRKLDRSKFPRHALVYTAWEPEKRVWICGLIPHHLTAELDPTAIGTGSDPMEAMFDMCINLGALDSTEVLN